MALLEREYLATEKQYQRELRDWWAERILFAAEAFGEDPAALARRLGASPLLRGALASVLPYGVSFPPGLRNEDQPQPRLRRVR